MGVMTDGANLKLVCKVFLALKLINDPPLTLTEMGFLLRNYCFWPRRDKAERKFIILPFHAKSVSSVERAGSLTIGQNSPSHFSASS